MRVLLAVVAVAVLGCGDGMPKGPALVPGGGKVTYRNKPVTGGNIAFTPVNVAGAETAQGYLDEKGTFILACPNFGPGIAPGQYKVTITFYGGSGPVPPKYNLPQSTPLLVDIPAGGKTDLDLKLVD